MSLKLTEGKKQFLKYVGVFFIGMMFAMIGQSDSSVQTKTVEKVVEKPVVNVVEKTPDACKRALELDNQVFQVTADGMEQMNFIKIADFVESVTVERTANYQECLNK